MLFFLDVEKDGSAEHMDTSEPAAQDPNDNNDSKGDSITSENTRGSPLLPGEETLHTHETVPLESEDSNSNVDNNMNEDSHSSHSSSGLSSRKPQSEEVSSLSREASVGVGDQVSLGRSSGTSTPVAGPMQEEVEPMEEGKGCLLCYWHRLLP